VQGKCLSEEVLPHTSHLHSELCVPRSSVGVGGAEEADGVVPFLENQHTDNFLVAIDNEVPSELVLVFCQFDQLFGSQFVEPTMMGIYPKLAVNVSTLSSICRVTSAIKGAVYVLPANLHS
jgi:hypothetical protein